VVFIVHPARPILNFIKVQSICLHAAPAEPGHPTAAQPCITAQSTGFIPHGIAKPPVACRPLISASMVMPPCQPSRYSLAPMLLLLVPTYAQKPIRTFGYGCGIMVLNILSTTKAAPDRLRSTVQHSYVWQRVQWVAKKAGASTQFMSHQAAPRFKFILLSTNAKPGYLSRLKIAIVQRRRVSPTIAACVCLFMIH